MAALELEQKIIKIVQNGDVDALKELGLRNNEANRPLTITQNVKIITPSKKCPFRMIHAPTILILSILCEQPKMLQFILDNFKPDLNYRVNGWSPLHYSCCTGSYECLQILLQYQFIQENIDQPVIEPNTKSDDSNFTTALHIAVTNHRHAQVILLTSELPNIIYGPNGEKLESPKPSEYQSTNIDHLSAHGSSALHIAAKTNDKDMVKILINAGADTNVTDSHNRTPLQLAQSSDNTAICELFEQTDTDFNEEILRENYLIPTEPNTINNSSTNEKDNSNEEPEDYVPKEEISMLNERIESLVGLIQLLNSRVQALEAKGKPEEIHICSRCGIQTNNKCEKCGEYYCENCISKPPHSCTN